MSLSLLAAAACTLAAAVLTMVLLRRCQRTPRMDLAAWAVAAAALTLALAAQAYGYKQGFGSMTFRVVQFGCQLLAPMALVWGMVELVGRGFWGRFLGRLGLGALTVIVGVILFADPLSAVAFTTLWPAASVHYQFIPKTMLDVITFVTVTSAVVALILAAVRGRRDPGWRGLTVPVAAATGGVLACLALRLALPVNSAYAVLCLAAAALAWFAARRSATLQLAALHEGPGGQRAGQPGRYSDDTGYGWYGADTGGFDRRSDTYGDPYRADTGGFDRGSDTYGDLYRDGTGGAGRGSDTFGDLYRADGGFTGDSSYDLYRGGPGFDDTGVGQELPGDLASVVETGDMLLPPELAAGVDTSQLYGQIAIYTLIDGQVDEFDRLTRQVVEKVKTGEPGTLVYVVHGVPSAPMQRILYEVYRDEAAYAEHREQPYVVAFEEERKPYVLATNVIQLGVNQAKFSPLEGQPPGGGAGGAGGVTQGPGGPAQPRGPQPRGPQPRGPQPRGPEPRGPFDPGGHSPAGEPGRAGSDRRRPPPDQPWAAGGPPRAGGDWPEDGDQPWAGSPPRAGRDRRGDDPLGGDPLRDGLPGGERLVGDQPRAPERRYEDGPPADGRARHPRGGAR